MLMRTEALPGDFGIAVYEIDAKQELDFETQKQLADLLHENLVIVVKDQDIDLAQYDRFGRIFGVPHPHVIEQARLPDWPGIMGISNKTKEGKRAGNGAAHWHTDQSYEAEVATSTMLYAVKVPDYGGETYFANMRMAYADLGDEMKSRIDGLKAYHLYGAGVAAREGETDPGALQGQEQVNSVPMVTHLLARPHSVTGEVFLYSPAGTSRGIEGMDQDEATDLLNELTDHALQEKYCYAHFHTPGDIAIWDTQGTMHHASLNQADERPESSRFLYRISSKGAPAAYA